MNREQRTHGEINITHDCSQRVSVRKERGIFLWDGDMQISTVIESRNAAVREVRQ